MSRPWSHHPTQFIKLLTNDESVEIGHDVDSATTKVASHSYMHSPDIRITLLDTPGFEDSRDGVSDVDILQEITDFLGPSRFAISCCRDGRISKLSLSKLDGLLYLHRISDPRVGKVSRRNLQMFKRLCGDEALKHSIIVTTFWGGVSEEVGLRREEQLRADKTLFKALLENGAQVMRHDSELKSARDIMEHIVDMVPVNLQIQDELSSGTALRDTAAGQMVMENIREMLEKHQKELEDLREEMREAAEKNNQALMNEIEEERKTVEEAMRKNQDNYIKLELQAKQTEDELERIRTEYLNLRKELEDIMNRSDELTSKLNNQDLAPKEKDQLKEQLSQLMKRFQELQTEATKYAKGTRGVFWRFAAGYAEQMDGMCKSGAASAGLPGACLAAGFGVFVAPVVGIKCAIFG
jgi:hypothetical protein